MRLIEVVFSFPPEQYIDIIVVAKFIKCSNKRILRQDAIEADTNLIFSGLVNELLVVHTPIDRYLQYSVIGQFSGINDQEVDYITVIIQKKK